MNGILLTSKSVTYAQQMKKTLEQNGFFAEIVRPDTELTKGSCAYAVNISQKFLPEAMEILRRNRIPPVRVILIEGRKLYREIRI
ncbi:MAG: DUF3343 domain-containing protein [Oscillospiraceae bacterium]|nr:DUF3343 domain-containing protein [Oscillospiraceae bacterium]